MGRSLTYCIYTWQVIWSFDDYSLFTWIFSIGGKKREEDLHFIFKKFHVLAKKSFFCHLYRRSDHAYHAFPVYQKCHDNTIANSSQPVHLEIATKNESGGITSQNGNAPSKGIFRFSDHVNIKDQIFMITIIIIIILLWMGKGPTWRERRGGGRAGELV